MLIVITYDIPDDRRRTRLAKALEDFGDRVQYSVFEALLQPPEEIEELRVRITREINPDEDSVRIYSLCRNCEGRLFCMGLARKTMLPDTFIL